MENRGKQKQRFTIDIGLRDFYIYYMKRNLDIKINKTRLDYLPKNTIKSKYLVDYKKYRDIVKDLNLELRDKILKKSLDFKMPSRMGYIGIRKNKTVYKIDESGKVKCNLSVVNWPATKEMWKNNPEAKAQKKLVKVLNEHSDGYVYRWYYNKFTANYKWKSAYCFIPCRTAKLELNKIIMDEESSFDCFERR